MSVDSKAFRDALGRFGSGVTVVSVNSPEGVRGITVSAFSSVSMEPPTVLVCIGKKSRAHDLVLSAGVFGVSLLAEGQRPLSDRFAGRPDVVEEPVWRTEGWGTPVLDGALAQLDCVVSQSVDVGDHTVCFGQVVRAESGDGAPLVYWRGRYRALADASVG